MAEPAPTLPDLLRPALEVVFVGINPSLYSARHGHYFARPISRFWPAFSRSRLSLAARQALRVERLASVHDRALLDHGFGFTDLVKRASARADEIMPAELAAGVALLANKLTRYTPRFACLHGITVARPVLRALAPDAPPPVLGLLPFALGPTRIFLVPNPSPANAHFTPADQTRWYDALATALGR